jgi:putative SOS response-associated peptidase YedK
LAEEFDIDDIVGELPGPDYNVAPTVEVPAILERRAKDDQGQATDEVRRRLTPLVWGLVPSWSKGPGTGAKMINARYETVAAKPAFKRACGVRRCLLPADGYYEWYDAAKGSDGSHGKPRKQPFFIHRGDGQRLVMAGLYEFWRDPAKDADDDSAWLRTCTVITTTATDSLGHIHDRMPMVVPADRWAGWLDPRLTDPEEARQLLTVTDADQLEAYAVSRLVSNVKNNGPELLTPLADEPDDDVGAEETLF